jgi:hypothetical protein
MLPKKIGDIKFEKVGIEKDNLPTICNYPYEILSFID